MSFPRCPKLTKQEVISKTKQCLPKSMTDELPGLTRKTYQQLVELAADKQVQIQPGAKKSDIMHAIAEDHNKKLAAIPPNKRHVGFGKHAMKTWTEILDLPDYCDHVVYVYSQPNANCSARFRALAQFLQDCGVGDDSEDNVEEKKPHKTTMVQRRCTPRSKTWGRPTTSTGRPRPTWTRAAVLDLPVGVNHQTILRRSTRTFVQIHVPVRLGRRRQKRVDRSSR